MKNNRALSRSCLGIVLAILLVLSGCASKSSAPVASTGAARDSYTVKPGDTLYSIAREHGMDFRELITLNGIDNPNRITVGKVLKVRPPAAAISSSAATSSVATTAPVVSDVVQARPLGAETVPEKRPLGSNTEMFKKEPKAGKETYSDQALAQAQAQSQVQSQTPIKPSEPLPLGVRAEASPEVKPESRPETKTEARPAWWHASCANLPSGPMPARPIWPKPARRATRNPCFSMR